MLNKVIKISAIKWPVKNENSIFSLHLPDKPLTLFKCPLYWLNGKMVKLYVDIKL